MDNDEYPKAFLIIKEALKFLLGHYKTNVKHPEELKTHHYKLMFKDRFDLSKNADGIVMDYAPDVFQTFRKVNGVQDQVLLDSFSEPARQIISSRPLFYTQVFSHIAKYVCMLVSTTGVDILAIMHASHRYDRKFVIKQTSASSVATFISYLREYIEHFLEHPQTLLVRVYGVYRIKTPRNRKIHFMIMENIFYPAKGITRRFDLKGCKNRRKVIPSLEAHCRGDPYILKEDGLKWQKLATDTFAHPFFEQLQVDLEFLYKQGLIGYSLLIGVQPLPLLSDAQDAPVRSVTKQARKKHAKTSSFFRRRPKRISNTQWLQADVDSPSAAPIPELVPFRRMKGRYDVFYFGLVSLFKRYSTYDEILGCFKTILHQSPNHTSVQPDIYQERLLQFVYQHFKERQQTRKSHHVLH